MILASVVSLKKFKLIYESTFAILFVTLHTQRVLHVLKTGPYIILTIQ